MFKSRPEHYGFNIKQAADFTARPAVINAPEGHTEPAVILRTLGSIQGVLPVTEALRIANEIADALAAHNGKAN